MDDQPRRPRNIPRQGTRAIHRRRQRAARHIRAVPHHSKAHPAHIVAQIGHAQRQDHHVIVEDPWVGVRRGQHIERALDGAHLAGAFQQAHKIVTVPRVVQVDIAGFAIHQPIVYLVVVVHIHLDNKTCLGRRRPRAIGDKRKIDHHLAVHFHRPGDAHVAQVGMGIARRVGVAQRPGADGGAAGEQLEQSDHRHGACWRGCGGQRAPCHGIGIRAIGRSGEVQGRAAERYLADGMGQRVYRDMDRHTLGRGGRECHIAAHLIQPRCPIRRGLARRVRQPRQVGCAAAQRDRNRRAVKGRHGDDRAGGDFHTHPRQRAHRHIAHGGGDRLGGLVGDLQHPHNVCLIADRHATKAHAHSVGRICVIGNQVALQRGCGVHPSGPHTQQGVGRGRHCGRHCGRRQRIGGGIHDQCLEFTRRPARRALFWVGLAQQRHHPRHHRRGHGRAGASGPLRACAAARRHNAYARRADVRLERMIQPPRPARRKTRQLAITGCLTVLQQHIRCRHRQCGIGHAGAARAVMRVARVARGRDYDDPQLGRILDRDHGRVISNAKARPQR